MSEFLKIALSADRWRTYEILSEERGLPADDLYHRNILYSKELYVILGGLEVVIRNAFHAKLNHRKSGADWFTHALAEGIFHHHHKKQLDSAIKNLTRNKAGDYVLADLVAELNFGFWVHLTNAPYEQRFWVPALRHCFPHKFGRPVRQDIESRLKDLLKLRNKIAHLEPIIRHEKQLIQAYKNAYDIIAWICPETANWFDRNNSFKEIWKAYNTEGNQET